MGRRMGRRLGLFIGGWLARDLGPSRRDMAGWMIPPNEREDILEEWQQNAGEWWTFEQNREDVCWCGEIHR